MSAYPEETVSHILDSFSVKGTYVALVIATTALYSIDSSFSRSGDLVTSNSLI